MTNKNGEKKLLAMIMALTMVLVAGFVLIGGSEADATVGIETDVPSDAMELPDVGEISATTAGYKVTQNSEVTIPGKASSNATIDFYVIPGVTIKVNGEEGAGTGTVTIEFHPANSDCTKVLEGDSIITLSEMNSGYIEVENFKFGTASTNDSELKVCGVPEGTVAITGTVLIKDQGTFEYEGDVSSWSSLCYGIHVEDGDVNEYYPAGAKALDINLDSEGKTVTIINGTVRVQQGSNIVEMEDSQDIMTGTAGTIMKGTSFPVVSSSGSDAKVTLIRGYASHEASITGLKDVVTYTVSAGEPIASETKYVSASEILSDSDLIGLGVDSKVIMSVTSGRVVGEVIQYQSVVVSESSSFAGVVVSDGSKLVIDQSAVVGTKVNVVSGAKLIVEGELSGSLIMDPAGEMYVYGIVSSDMSTEINGVIHIGPSGYIGEGSAATIYNTITGGKDNEVGAILEGAVENALMITDAEIPADKAYEINGNFGLNGNNLTVNGTLIISDGANVFGTGVETITLGQKGSIVYNGTLAKMMPIDIFDTTETVTIQGVTGGYVAIEDSTLAITGHIEAMDGAVVSKVELTVGVLINGSFGVGEGVSFIVATDGTTGEANPVADGAEVIIDGEFYGPIKAVGKVSIDARNGVILNGSQISVRYGLTSADSYTIMDVIHKTSELDLVKNGNINGFIIDVVKVGTGSNAEYVVSINGEINFKEPANKVMVSGVETRIASVDVKITGSYSVTDELVIGKGVFLHSTAILELQGTLTTEGNCNISNYVGAYYGATGGIYYYTTLDNALSNIGTASSKTVFAKGAIVLENGFTLKDGQTLNITGSTFTIGPDAIVIAESGSKIVGIIADVDGKLTKQKGAVVDAPAAYDSTYPVGTDVIYAGLAIAIKESDGKEPIAVVDSSFNGDLTIRGGVTVEVSKNLSINGNLIIEDGATLVGGTIVVAGTSSEKSEVIIDGTMDLLKGVLSMTNVSSVYINGTAKVTNFIASANGSYYEIEGGYVYTTVDKAVQSGKDVVIVGEVSCNDSITIAEGKSLIADSSADVRIAEIVLSVNASVTIDGELNAVVKTADASMKIVGEISVKNYAATTETASYTGIASFNGKLDVLEGTVSLTGSVGVTDGEVAIDNGAELIVVKTANLSIMSGASITIDGTLTVDGKFVDSNDGVQVVGKLSINNKNSEVGTLEILGEVVVKDGVKLSVDGNVIIGSYNGLGSNGALVGEIYFVGDDRYVMAYADAALDEAVIPDRETALYINGAEFATVYANDVDLTLDMVITPDVLAEVPGVVVPDDSEIYEMRWVKENGTSATTPNITIGKQAKVSANLALEKVFVQIFVQQGINLELGKGYYDINNAFRGAELSIGENLAKGTSADGKSVVVKYFVNGVESVVTDEKIIITADMIGQEVIVQASYGTAPAPTPVQPAEPTEDYVVSTSVVDDKVVVSVISLDEGYLVEGTTVTVTFSTLVETTAFGQTIYKPVPVEETITIGDDKPTIKNETYQLAEILGERYAVVSVVSTVGTTNFGNMTLNYRA